MSIKHAIAHRLSRLPDTEAQLNARERELPTEGRSETLLDKLKSSFLARISREHGSFNSDEPGPLQGLLEGYLGDEQDFTAMTTALLQQFQLLLDKHDVVFDGHVLCYIEQSFDHHLFHLFVASNSESLSFNEALELVPSYAIDTGSSLFGIKVDLAEWKERRDYAYLSLLPPRGNPQLAEAFAALTGFGNGLNKEEATLSFLEGIENYARELPQEKVDDYRNRVVEYCMEREEQDAPVQLRSLAENLEDIDSESFLRSVGGDSADQSAELMLDRRSLRRYVKFAGREKDLAISFNSYQLNKRVHYDAGTDTLSINGLPSALRKQLQGHLDSKEP